ncbi:hypothetical protein EV137_0078 [Kribbella pratensis]|uniref:Uncharacterized protein n=1 Tax=Kribbella pratensis TaxID=2512112 RepID=A0ABY2FI73_9ACTN|nr:hypothetical protein EV137_0078 [Kribbella pratensis]
MRAGAAGGFDDGTALGVTAGGVLLGAVLVGAGVEEGALEGVEEPLSFPPEQAVNASMRTAEQATARRDFVMGVSWWQRAWVGRCRPDFPAHQNNQLRSRRDRTHRMNRLKPPNVTPVTKL